MSEFKRKLTRGVFGLMRGLTPVLHIGFRVFVLRYEDVVEVLSRDKDFTVSQLSYENISRRIGPFFLGMDDGPEYQRERTIMQKIIQRDDMTRIQDFARSKSREFVEKAVEKGQFNLVDEFARLLPLELLGVYLGAPGPDAKTALHWHRTLFWDIFMNLNNDPEIAKNAEKSAAEFKAYLQELISDRQAAKASGGRLPNDLISRLITLQDTGEPSLDDDGIRRNISGTILGGVENINKAICNIWGQFQIRPEVMAAARSAAKSDDMETLRGLAYEAFRFHPFTPVLLRYCEKDQWIGGEGRKRRKIKGGKTVFVGTLSAMFDPRSIPNPKKFDGTRSSSAWLYQGYGLHDCYGRYINDIAIPEMLAALLRVDGLGPIGEIEYEGPFPSHWNWKKG